MFWSPFVPLKSYSKCSPIDFFFSLHFLLSSFRSILSYLLIIQYIFWFWLELITVIFMAFIVFEYSLILILDLKFSRCHTNGCIHIVQFSSAAQSYPILCDPMNCSTPGLPVHHQLPEFTQTYVHWVHAAIQPSHPWSSPSPPAPNPSQHQSLFQWVNSSHEGAKVLEFQL